MEPTLYITFKTDRTLTRSKWKFLYREARIMYRERCKEIQKALTHMLLYGTTQIGWKEKRNRYTLTHIPTCPYCDTLSTYTSSETIFGKDYGMIYLCGFCRAYVGCHKGTNIPLGTMANSELRKLRAKCHELFDPIWRNGKMSRPEAYGWLADKLGLSIDETHFGMFDEEHCRKSIALLSNQYELL